MPPATEPLRIVQVGAGSMGRTWLSTVADSVDCTLVGLVDLDPDVARQAAAQTGHDGVAVAGSLEELLTTIEADAVVNVTIPAAHPSVSITALRHGLPVLGEKPLAETVSQALPMAAAAELTGTLLMVSQSRRYNRQVETLSKLIAQLDDVGSLDCTFYKAPHFGGFREEMAHPLLIDMAIHQFDLARLLTGADPIAVYCDSYNPSWSWFHGDAAANAIFEFAGGARFSFSGSWCAPGLETSWNGSWRVGGSGGTALWDGDNLPSAEDSDGRPLSSPSGTLPESTAGSLAEFVQAVRTADRHPSGEVHSNLLSLAMVQAATRSADQHRRVTVAEILDDGYRQALLDDTADDLLQVMKDWSSVHDVVGADHSRTL